MGRARIIVQWRVWSQVGRTFRETIMLIVCVRMIKQCACSRNSLMPTCTHPSGREQATRDMTGMHHRTLSRDTWRELRALQRYSSKVHWVGSQGTKRKERTAWENSTKRALADSTRLVLTFGLAKTITWTFVNWSDGWRHCEAKMLPTEFAESLAQ
jgi:hypothetical protein